jgi:hypothetical protein
LRHCSSACGVSKPELPALQITLDKTFLTERVSRVSGRIMMSVEEGLRTVLAL